MAERSKPRYLNDLPLVIRYVRQALAMHAEFDEFLRWFDERVMPAVNTQSWAQ